ncbi:GNAT family N-acetyltransferase [Paenibacillus chartarius]|uniref:GNAT family N-acetyltransferase n=1 Tax=Paenibacillus chartarius TaxID=747481 RepID=A0ABV6DSS5_9BACL
MNKPSWDDLIIREVAATNADLRSLIAKLDEDLQQRYPVEEIFTLDLDAPEMDEVTFIVTFISGQAVGCSAIRPLNGEQAELKRFFVDPAFRKRGIASRMLEYLEARSIERGFKELLLETGEEQPEAIALYVKHGFAPIPSYGEYVDCPSSRCYAKSIG